MPEHRDPAQAERAAHPVQVVDHRAAPATESTVLVDVAPTPVRLGKGQFFGEIALLRDTVRTATITTASECQLLSLDVADFRRLLEVNPTLKATITRIADERLPAAMPGGASPGAPSSPPA